MKLRFVLCRPAPELYGERREGLLAAELRALGHDAAVLRAEAAPAPRVTEAEGGAPFFHFPSDAPGLQAHRQGSAARVEWLRADAPDVVLFKGMDYDIVAHCLEALNRARCRIGFVIGGTSLHPNLAATDFVLAESEGQAEAVARHFCHALPAARLPKHIDWPAADAAHAATRARRQAFRPLQCRRLRATQEPGGAGAPLPRLPHRAR